jgi:hypothetical protein
MWSRTSRVRLARSSSPAAMISADRAINRSITRSAMATRIAVLLSKCR